MNVWVYARLINYIAKREKNVDFNVQSHFCLPKPYEKYQMPSEWFLSVICLGLNLPVIAGSALSTASYYAQVFWGHF